MQENSELSGGAAKLMKRKPLRRIAHEITQRLVLEMSKNQGLEESARPSMVDLLLQQLVTDVVKELKDVILAELLSDEELVAKLQKEELQKAERKLDEVAIQDENKDELFLIVL